MPGYIFADLNVFDPFVSDSKDTLLYDTKVVVQSLWRLLTTQVGEIPNFRSYGLDIKKYVQYPLTTETVKEIYNYVKDRVEIFEQRADIIQCQFDVDMNLGEIYYNLIIRVKSTNEVVSLPTFVVHIGGTSV